MGLLVVRTPLSVNASLTTTAWAYWPNALGLRCLVLNEVDATNQLKKGLSKEFRTNKIYSEELKKEAVFKVLSGELRKSEAMEAYGIKGSPSLDRWLERYGHGILSEHKELLEQMGRRKKKVAVIITAFLVK